MNLVYRKHSWWDKGYWAIYTPKDKILATVIAYKLGDIGKRITQQIKFLPIK